MIFFKEGAFEEGAIKGYGKDMSGSQAKVGYFNGSWNLNGKGIKYESFKDPLVGIFPGDSDVPWLTNDFTDFS